MKTSETTAVAQRTDFGGAVMEDVLAKRGVSCFESAVTGCGREELGSDNSLAVGGECLESV